jgi:hypothetical protein
VTAGQSLYILLIKGNAPCVRSVFAAIPPEVSFSAVRRRGLSLCIMRTNASCKRVELLTESS